MKKVTVLAIDPKLDFADKPAVSEIDEIIFTHNSSAIPFNVGETYETHKDPYIPSTKFTIKKITELNNDNTTPKVNRIFIEVEGYNICITPTELLMFYFGVISYHQFIYIS